MLKQAGTKLTGVDFETGFWLTGLAWFGKQIS